MNENNRLIAGFMGYREITNTLNPLFNKIKGGFQPGYFQLPEYREDIQANVAHYSRFKFHTSWDWLMPVVEKIEAMHGMYVDIYRDATKIRYCPKEISEWVTIPYDQETKINHVYKAVIEFIKFHNMDNLTYTSLKQKPRKRWTHVLASDGKQFATPGLATAYMKLWNLKGKLRFVR